MRGGLLGQGSILTVTSYANRTSPVHRGKWILENLLGTPVPPPPVNVPPLPEERAGREDPDDARADGPASRQRRVRELPSADGSRRAGNRKLRRDRPLAHAERSRRPIDASGGLPDGSTFDGAIGLRKAVLNRPELFVTTLTEKLMTYALGRGLEYYDAPAVRDISRRARHG